MKMDTTGANDKSIYVETFMLEYFNVLCTSISESYLQTNSIRRMVT